MVKFAFLMTALIGTMLLAKCQIPYYNLNQLKVEDGLSQSNVNQVLRDSKGFIWIATDNGLNRYDGYDFEIYQNIPSDSTSISDNSIWAILEDKNGNIWAGTNQGGLNHFNRQTKKFTRYVYEQGKNSLSQNSVLSLLQHSDGSLWIGTYWGLNQFDPNSGQFTNLFFDPENEAGLLDNAIFSMIEDQEGNVWVGTSAGVTVLKSDGTFLFNLKSGVAEKELNYGNVTKIYQDQNATVWIGTEGGLHQYRKGEGIVKKHVKNLQSSSQLQSNIIRDIYRDSKGRFWVGTDGGGLSFYDDASESFTPALSNSAFTQELLNFVYHVYEDEQGILWFGSYGNGVLMLNEDEISFRAFSHEKGNPKSLSNNSVLCFQEKEDGILWIGTDGGGLNCFDPITEEFLNWKHNPEDPNSISGDVVKSVLEDSKGDLWVGTYAHGLNRKKKGTDQFIRYTNDVLDSTSLSDNDVWQILERKNGELWLGTLGGGINIFQPETEDFKKLRNIYDYQSTFSSATITCLFEDSEQNIWVGTEGSGLTWIDGKTNSVLAYFKSAEEVGSLSNNEIRAIFEDRDNAIWIGTSNGLNKFDKNTRHFTIYNVQGGLPNGAIKGILQAQDGQFWLSTNNGMSRFNELNKTFRNFNLGDGLQGAEFNYNASILSSSGLMYFGGLNGFNQFDPEKIVENKKEVPVVFTSLKIFNKEVVIDSLAPIHQNIVLANQITFQPDQFVFNIGFTAIDYVLPKVNEYAYKLEGFDPDWNFSGKEHHANYTNIPPGEYVFLVKATNNDGVWNRNYASINITVLSPWYKTKTAQAVFITLVVLIFLGIVRWRTSYLKNQKRELTRLVAERTAQVEKQKDEIIEKSTELRDVNKNLESLVDQRTKGMQKALMKQKESEKELSRFLYRASHDLKGPVTSLKGLALLGIKEEELSMARSYFDRINITSSALLELLKKLTVVNSIFYDGLKITKVDWDFIEGLKKEFERKFKQTSIIIESSTKQSFYSDEFLLRTILENLIENAIHFNSREEKQILVSIKDCKTGVELKVRDNGNGIPQEQLPQIFKMFHRASEASQGTGLGLYIVKKCSDELRASCTVKSDSESYTEFTILLGDTQSAKDNANRSW